ncbi:MAG: succinate dehydrogenase cytochrome b subunit [Leptospiraceae bacterium]|nr:succinate dehydrogenase cytochrome b subunit [Leptospiraceae bacterium]MCB1303740.1 succinate dehydrogenase cytochrome b subunit [Leptospiraceae bacterium]
MILKRLFGSSIGRKILVATTGLLLIGFVLMHMLGNWNMFFGREEMNTYAAFLKSIPGPLWTARIGLIVVFILHVIIALKLKMESSAARPVGYKKGNTMRASLASRYMAQTGLLILAFIIYHLLHFTFGQVDPNTFSLLDDKGRHDVYGMVVHSFQNPLVSASYIIAMFFLAMHLIHAVQSMLQTFGLAGEQSRPLVQKISVGVALFFFIGYSAIPVSILAGLVGLNG